MAPVESVHVEATTPEPVAEAREEIRGEVVLVVLGSFPPDLVDAVEAKLREELQVEVTRRAVRDLPKAAYYKPRRRYRADKLLDHLLTLIPNAPKTTRVLGLTEVDISTTNGPHKDWGIFGLGLVPGQAAVISSYRLRRRAKNREHLKFRVAVTATHEIGHTFGLPHCTHEGCVMQDAEGSIKNTDTGTGHLAHDCRARMNRQFPLL